MISIQVWTIMGECHVDARITHSSGVVGTKANWQGPLDEDAPVEDLISHVTNALLALDRVMGEVHEELLFGTG